MELKSLKRLRTLMEIHELSGRDVADIAGYKSHTYMARVLRGEYKVLGNEHALRLAAYFMVGLDDLFVVGVSSATEENEQSESDAA